jgi:high-affinity nickel permease
MRFRTFVATCAAAFLSLPVLTTTASAGSVLFDSLGGVISSGAYAGWVGPVISGTFNIEATPVRVNVALC